MLGSAGSSQPSENDLLGWFAFFFQKKEDDLHCMHAPCCSACHARSRRVVCGRQTTCCLTCWPIGSLSFWANISFWPIDLLDGFSYPTLPIFYLSCVPTSLRQLSIAHNLIICIYRRIIQISLRCDVIDINIFSLDELRSHHYYFVDYTYFSSV